MKSFERYKRLIKLGFSSMSAAMLIITYGMVWINYYNKVILAPFYRKGNWMMIFIYGVLLIFFMKMYGGWIPEKGEFDLFPDTGCCFYKYDYIFSDSSTG